MRIADILQSLLPRANGRQVGHIMRKATQELRYLANDHAETSGYLTSSSSSHIQGRNKRARANGLVRTNGLVGMRQLLVKNLVCTLSHSKAVTSQI